MIRALIVDDERLARDKLRRMLAAVDDVTVVGEHATGAAAVAAIGAVAPDLLLLDVQMPEVDGFAVVRALGERPVAIVFVTAHGRHAVRAFDVAAVDYLLKPFTQRRLEVALERVRAHLVRARGEAPAALDRILVRSGDRLISLRVEQIERFEADDNYVRVHAGGPDYQLIRERMARLEAELDRRRFVRVHRSHLVNLDAVVEIRALDHGEYEVVLRSGAVVPVGRRYRDGLMEASGRR